MAVVEELIREEENGTISFGNYELADKTKKDGFMYMGDIYKIKTFCEITKLEKNGSFVYESVPGTAVHDFKATADRVEFAVEGHKDAQVTLELEPEQEYQIKVDGADAGTMKTNLGGKMSISALLEEKDRIFVEIDKIAE